MRLNLIAEPFKDSQLPSNIQCTPTYCNLEPGSKRVTVGLRNISTRKITVPSRTIVCQIQLANMVAPIQTSKEQPPTEIKREEGQRNSSMLLGNYYVIILKLFQKMIWIWVNVIF